MSPKEQASPPNSQVVGTVQRSHSGKRNRIVPAEGEKAKLLETLRLIDRGGMTIACDCVVSKGAIMLRKTPLHAAHSQAGAKFTDFAGFEMPVEYESQISEHRAVRSGAGIFDLSHMAEIFCEGAEVESFLDYSLSNKLSVLQNSQAKYSLLLAADGGVIDDLIVYRLEPKRFLLVANAANRDVAFETLSERAKGFEVSVSDQSDQWALIAVQGPKASEILRLSPLTLGVELGELGYYWLTDGKFGDEELLVARTGYTGEDGFEILVKAHAAELLWSALLNVGGEGPTLCGLASRDTLRLEAGMPLYGQELSLNVSPAQAGLSWVVNNSKGKFVGQDVALESKSSRVLTGLVAEGKRAPRAGYSVLDSQEIRIGEISSGALSPSLGYPIAMAYIEEEFVQPGTQLMVDVRGAKLPVNVHPLPFYSRKKAVQ